MSLPSSTQPASHQPAATNIAANANGAGLQSTLGGVTSDDDKEPRVHGGDWVRYWDESANIAYFYNVLTEETSWVDPLTAAQSDSGSEGSGGGEESEVEIAIRVTR